MPFWWRRRRRFWNPRRRWKRKTYRRRRRPLHKRRRPRRHYRKRRRRRRYKVRRKRKLITVKQWQPDSIVNCKIKGVGTLVLGAQGKQAVCYTNVKQSWTPPKAPGGGGFGCEQFSLGMLYQEYIFRKNIWTKSNIGKDLCRYIKVKFTFYRHPETDFVVAYERQPPFTIDELTYMFCHPQNLLLSKHKFLVLSTATAPQGKLKITKTIKPPKQMLTKWFFQEHFSEAPLLMLRAAACNFRYTNLGCCNKNQIITFFSLNDQFYLQGNWANSQAQYKPWITAPNTLYYFKTKIPDPTTWGQMSDTETQKWIKDNMQTQTIKNYNESVSFEKGFFASFVLTAQDVGNITTYPFGKQANTPTTIIRYNVNLDTGKGNAIWLHSSLATSYDKPSIDKSLILQGYPLWMMLWGWLSYVQYIKKATDFFTAHILVMQSPAFSLQTGGTPPKYIIPIATDFVNGKPPYGEPLSTWWRAHWYPNIYDQFPVINAIVCAGPYVPKLDETRNSTWELKYHYNFFFKWGGPELTEPAIADPSQQPTYNVPDTFYGSVQIRNPAKQKYESLIHPWDYRRGILKKSALKRMQDNLSIDSTFEPDGSPQKKRKITGPCLTAPEEENQEIFTCLQELCEESTSQEMQETQNLELLIKQQQQKQHQLKWNLLKLISELKEKQRELQLQTGFIT
nr:MAG: ORF1 [Torque teno midi virus]